MKSMKSNNILLKIIIIYYYCGRECNRTPFNYVKFNTSQYYMHFYIL